MKKLKIAFTAALVVMLHSYEASAQRSGAALDTLKELPAVLPDRKDSFIERADAGEQPSGFAIRGIKGLAWTPDQYLKEIPVLANYKMNFMMNCYLSFFTRPKGAEYEWKTWDHLKNEWWLPLTPQVKTDYEKIFKAAKANKIDFCFSIHPQLASARPANLRSEEDFKILASHYLWAQSKGVEWFSVTIDDITITDGSDHTTYGEDQALYVNKLLALLRKKNKKVKMIFCPTHYAGLGKDPKEKAYLETIAKVLDKDVYVFWTGPQVTSPFITSEDARTFKDLVQHKLILWDNFPVNDNITSTAHLGPLNGRAKDLHTVIDGFMSNPMGLQSEINRIPMFTIADYAYNPTAYDPKSSIGQAILHQTDDKAKQQVLYELTKLYTGRIDVGFNPVVFQFDNITKSAFSEYLAKAYLTNFRKIKSEFEQAFPKDYKGMKITLGQTSNILDDIYKNNY